METIKKDVKLWLGVAAVSMLTLDKYLISYSLTFKEAFDSDLLTKKEYDSLIINIKVMRDSLVNIKGILDKYFENNHRRKCAEAKARRILGR